MKKSTKNNLFLYEIVIYPQSCIKLHLKKLAKNTFLKKIAFNCNFYTKLH